MPRRFRGFGLDALLLDTQESKVSSIVTVETEESIVLRDNNSGALSLLSIIGSGGSKTSCFPLVWLERIVPVPGKFHPADELILAFSTVLLGCQKVTDRELGDAMFVLCLEKDAIELEGAITAKMISEGCLAQITLVFLSKYECAHVITVTAKYKLSKLHSKVLLNIRLHTIPSLCGTSLSVS